MPENTRTEFTPHAAYTSAAKGCGSYGSGAMRNTFKLHPLCDTGGLLILPEEKLYSQLLLPVGATPVLFGRRRHCTHHGKMPNAKGGIFWRTSLFSNRLTVLIQYGVPPGVTPDAATRLSPPIPGAQTPTSRDMFPLITLALSVQRICAISGRRRQTGRPPAFFQLPQLVCRNTLPQTTSPTMHTTSQNSQTCRPPVVFQLPRLGCRKTLPQTPSPPMHTANQNTQICRPHVVLPFLPSPIMLVLTIPTYKVAARGLSQALAAADHLTLFPRSALARAPNCARPCNG